jgi:hypothetical protein
MISRVLIAVLTMLTVVSSGSAVLADVWVVREDGVGPVKIGMSLPQLNAALHERFAMPEAKEDQGCFYVTSTKHPVVSFMIEDGVVVRVDVDGAGLSTAEGIEVGDSEARARKIYGSKMKVEPHQYTGPEGHYLTIRSENGKLGIRFETDKGKIARFYAGKFEAVQYVEGCS